MDPGWSGDHEGEEQQMGAQDTVCVISILVSNRKKKNKPTVASCYPGQTECRIRTEVCLMGTRGWGP